ncbi:MAG: SURF1 family protein [Chloroflexaceae bacterium]|jgi:surfeit locus 1 family protein|nr:SURF1 family protein [Chloroflexaceae bacterium]
MHRLLTPGWIFKHLFALLILAMMVWLGFWQLNRLEQRRSHNASLIAALSQPAQLISGGPVDGEALHFHNIRVSGTFDNSQSMLLRNQQVNGQNGVHLLTPLRLTGSDQAIIVDRGWLPADPRGRAEVAPYAVAGEVTLEGVAMKGQSRPDNWLAGLDVAMPDETRIEAWLRVDLQKMQTQLPYQLLPIYVQQSPAPGTAPEALPRPQATADLDEGPHLSYALQWFGFSAMLIVVYTLLIRQELQKPGRRAHVGSRQAEGRQVG